MKDKNVKRLWNTITEKLEQWLEKYNQVSRDFYNGKYCNKENCSLLKAKEQECDKWESYYELYRIETDIVKKVQAVINDNPKYGIEFTKNGIIDKDERLSYLELHEQIKLIIDEQAKQLKRKEQECEEYANKVEYIHAFLKDPHNYGSFKPMWGSFLLHWLFNENLGDFFPQEAYEMTDTITEKEKQIIKYKQALDEIENYVRDNSDFDKSDKLASNTGAYDILDIINKTKGE